MRAEFAMAAAISIASCTIAEPACPKRLVSRRCLEADPTSIVGQLPRSIAHESSVIASVKPL